MTNRRTFIAMLAGGAVAAAKGIGFDFDLVQLADVGILVEHQCQPDILTDQWYHRWKVMVGGQDTYVVDALYHSKYPDGRSTQAAFAYLDQHIHARHPEIPRLLFTVCA